MGHRVVSRWFHRGWGVTGCERYDVSTGGNVSEPRVPTVSSRKVSPFLFGKGSRGNEYSFRELIPGTLEVPRERQFVFGSTTSVFSVLRRRRPSVRDVPTGVRG